MDEQEFFNKIKELQKQRDLLKKDVTVLECKINELRDILELKNIKKGYYTNNLGLFCKVYDIEGDLIRKSNGIYIRRHKYLSAIVDASTVCIFTGLTDKNGTPIYEGDIVIYRDNNAERRGSINWDSKAAAFYFGQDFLVHYPSENMVVVGNEFDI